MLKYGANYNEIGIGFQIPCCTVVTTNTVILKNILIT